MSFLLQKWQLQQHLAVEHGASNELQCKDCGKIFKWPRNLLAHLATSHQVSRLSYTEEAA
jgi:uncharacterized Zn-finger protein